MRSVFILLFVVLVLGAAAAQADDSVRLANYFVCTLEEGKTRADLMKFKVGYEEAVAAAGLDGYELRLQFPMYWGGADGDNFVWEGSWKDLQEMDRISKWFRQSEWPARFDELMACKNSSLWRVVD